ncbi:hypothetical protein [Amphritea sp.]|uniref:hypothetical protein n=1 Tax=Amphritea sp. TaxID=1872502 RepID=UPI003A8EB85F
MSVATDKTLIVMIEQKDVFFKLIDYLDAQELGEEIPLSLYYESIRALLNRQSDEREKRRLQEVFEPENLLRAGLLIELDKHRGILVLQNFVLDMFRHFDRSRLRELSSEQLEVLRQSLNHSLERMQTCVMFQGDVVFEEILGAFYENVRTTLGRIKQNVSSLQGQAEHLSKIIEEHDFSNLEQTQQVNKALEEISRIYQRHVLPTLQFLNEQENLKSGLPALTAIGEIAVLLEKAGLPVISQRVLFAKNSIRSYAKDVELIRKTLERYVRQSARQRQQYDCIEAVFNDLRAEAQNLQDGKLNTKYLANNSDVFALAHIFNGLKGQKFDAKLEWGNEHQSLLFAEHLRVALPKLRDTESKQLVRLTGLDNDAYRKEQEVTRRKRKIQRLIEQCELPVAHEDVHVFLHEFLQAHLKGYVLSDLLDSLGWLRSRLPCPLLPVFELRQISYSGMCLDYYPLSLGQQHD